MAILPDVSISLADSGTEHWFMQFTNKSVKLKYIGNDNPVCVKQQQDGQFTKIKLGMLLW